ncbi:MAG: hypothetical protein MUF22_06505 [Chitinispirillaceae bacterium]|jgi:hypothetical protein|nr:hypothetical protein [Chitinispirillaceae bacterium]
MLRDLDYLVQLQEIDLRIREQELAKELLPAAVIDLEQTIDKSKMAMDAAAAVLAQAESDFIGFEDKIRLAQEGLEKSQSRLNAIKTNREYDAVHAEIEAQKNILSSSETKKQKLADEVARLKALAETAVQEHAAIKAENDPKLAELRDKIAKLDSVIETINAERNALTPSISKPTLRTYNQILGKRKTAKVISLVDEARTCTVCYKMLEPQLMNEIKRATKIIMCQNCGSMFVWSGAKKPTES